jgi:hypothetical protein
VDALCIEQAVSGVEQPLPGRWSRTGHAFDDTRQICLTILLRR